MNTDTPTNVFSFPTSGKITPAAAINTIEEAMIKVQEAKAFYCEMIVEDIMGIVLGKAQVAGYSVLEDDAGVRDSIMVAESIKSLLCRTLNIHHYIQDVVDETIDLSDENGSAFSFNKASDMYED
jgi:hypothetical protein